MASEPLKGAQVSVTDRYKCLKHKADVVFSCKDCGGELVCLECLTTTHERHGLEKISDLASGKKEKIREYLERAEQTEIPNIKYNIQSADRQLQENSERFEYIENEIKSNGEKIKAEIDQITFECLEKCRAIFENNSELLSQYKQALESLSTELSGRVEKCKHTLQSQNDVIVLSSDAEIEKEVDQPSPPLLRDIELAGAIPEKQLEELKSYCFGTLNIQAKQVVAESETTKLNKPCHSMVVSQFEHSTGVRSITKATTDLVWIRGHASGSILLVNKKGKTKQKLAIGKLGIPRDISVSHVTGNLWMCLGRDIYEVTGKTPKKQFTIEIYPICMSVTTDDTVVVGVEKNVLLYSTAGQELYTARGSDCNIFVEPRCITTSGTIGDIAVCDCSNVFDMIERNKTRKCFVVVLNSKLGLKYLYNGPPQSLEGHSFEFDFQPSAAVYDSQGRILIADYSNKCIQLVSSEGQFLSIIYVDSYSKPLALTSTADGHLVVGFYYKSVKMIHYKT